MISKELLSEVLNLNMWKTDSLNISIDENKVYCNGIFLGDLGYQQSSYVVNIYELAHKCKKWAFNNGFGLTSGLLNYSKTKIAVLENIDLLMPKISFTGNTEPEAIFNACQWILDNKDSNDNI